MLRLSIILFCVVFLTIRASAVIDTSGFIHFSLQNGFPTNNVYSLVQDKFGFLWFATDNGVVRYNGYDLDIYNTERGLPANDVWEIVPDSAGRLWLKSFSHEFGYLKNGRYKKVNFQNKDRISTPAYIGFAGDLVVATFNSSFIHYLVVFNDDYLVDFPLSMKDIRLPGNTRLRHLSLGHNMFLAFWSEDSRLYRLKPGKEKASFSFIAKIPDELKNLYVSRIAISTEGEAFIYKINSTRYDKFNVNNGDLKSVDLKDLGAAPSEKIYVANPYFNTKNPDKKSYLITTSHIYTLDSTLSFLKREPTSGLIPSSSQLAFVFHEKSGTTWYTTHSDGTWLAPIESSFFTKALHPANDLARSRYIGSVGDKLFWWDNKNFILHEVIAGIIRRSFRFNDGLDIKHITGNDSVAYLSLSRGLYKYNVGSGEIQNVLDRYQVETHVYPSDRINREIPKTSLEQMRDIALINGSLYGLFIHGVIKFNFKGNKIISERLDSERHKGLFYDNRRNMLYCFSDNKITIINPATDKITVRLPAYLKAKGIGNIKQISRDKFGTIYLLDDNALFMCNHDFTSCQKVSLNFLLTDAFMQIVEERIFLAGKFGIAYIGIVAGGKLNSAYVLANRSLHFYRRPENFVIGKDGQAFLTTDRGMVQFHIDSFVKESSISEDAHSFFSLVQLQPFTSIISSGDTFKLKQVEEKLSLGVINYYGSGSVKYKYRVGCNKAWEESTSGEIFLGSLEPGEYYKVQCLVRDDLWQSKVADFYLYRYPYWWQTTKWKTFFWLVGIILFVGLVLTTILVTRYFVAQKNERRRALTELELRAIHAQINPHFIFNTLSASLYFINKKRFEDAYNHVSKFSKLLRAFLKSSQDRYVILQEEITMLKNYIELQQIRFENKFTYEIEVDNKLPLSNIKIPSLLLQPLVENAINHGLFHRDDGGLLTIRFRQGKDSTELICIIEDNGVGREAARKISEGNAARESYGTKLTNQLLEVFKQYEHFDISLTYTDKVMPETGTIVTLHLKNIKYVA